jgi:transposase InsO family protein
MFFTDIVYRFGVPNSIITDNGSQFTGRKFLEFCDEFHIRVDWAAVAQPQTNDQVERANGMILHSLKPRIFDRLNKSGRKWLQELPEKGNLAFPRKPSHSRGLLRGASPPPPRKNGPIFSQKIASSPTTPQPKPRASSGRARVAKRERRTIQR